MKLKKTEQDTWTGESETVLSVHINDVYFFDTKTGKSRQRYGVSVVGYSSASRDYKPADILLKSFSTHEAACAFAKKLIELIELIEE